MNGYFPDFLTYRLYTDSWVEISSQPSSSSLSSAADDIVTEGLRVQHGSTVRRRRRFRPGGPLQLSIENRASSFGSGASSQEEYDESESESDRIMSSSNEALSHPSPLRYETRPSALRRTSSGDAAASEGEVDMDDNGENSTAISQPLPTEQCFAPQPNAFTHPPALPFQPHQQYSSAPTGSNPPARPPARHSNQRHSYPSQSPPRPQHNPYNVISPAYQADHDAALRASLSTLLSCAAAARGLPKSAQTTTTRHMNPSARIVPSSLRLVPECVALGNANTLQDPTATDAAFSSSSSPDKPASPIESTKRRPATPPPATAAHGRSATKDARPAKKARRSGYSAASTASGAASVDDISPTLLTWVLSAGVVVIVSALSFSAGFVAGREAARAEMGVEGLNLGGVGGLLGAGDGVQDTAGTCGKEVWSRGLGLKKLRWGWSDVGSVGVRA